MMIDLNLIARVSVTAVALCLALPAKADPTPECNSGVPVDSLECGTGATASADGAQALGTRATATGQLSIGAGYEAQANNTRTTAVGTRAIANGLNSTAIGNVARADGMGASALGNGASAGGAGGVAIGVLSLTSADNTTAVGGRATASAVGATAIGRDAIASGASSTALGTSSRAAFAGSTAIGSGATTTAAGQVALGGAGSHVRIGDIAASTAAQDAASIGIATIDANGVIGRDANFLPAFAAQQQAIGALQSSADILFDLASRNQRDIREANEGVAMALAMESPAVPAGANVAVSAGIGHFKNRTAGTAAVSFRIGQNSAFSAGVGYGFGGNNVGARAGFQAAW
jgi:trimeric autotransporter adhesin